MKKLIIITLILLSLILSSCNEKEEEKLFAECSVLRFDAPNEAWLDFVAENRSGNYEGEDYDVVYGPVANDDVYTTFTLYQSGALSKEQTLETLKIKKLYDQMVFTTEKALFFLKFVLFSNFCIKISFAEFKLTLDGV